MMELDNSGQRMKILLTKGKLSLDKLLNSFEIPTLILMLEANKLLIKKMKFEEMLITTEDVKKIVRDDIKMAKVNREVLASTIRLKKYFHIEFLYLN